MRCTVNPSLQDDKTWILIYLNIFTTILQDEEGRCLSDSFSELPDRDPDEDLETSKLKE